MNYNDNDIEFMQSLSGDACQVRVGDYLTVTVSGSTVLLHSTREYGDLDKLDASRLAGALIAVETLTATSEHEAMNALTVALETMNDVRDKAGDAPLVDVDEVLARADAERVRDDLMYLLKSARRINHEH